MVGKPSASAPRALSSPSGSPWRSSGVAYRGFALDPALVVLCLIFVLGFLLF
jgi:hypothetical protein